MGDGLKGPLYIDVAALYQAVTREMAFKGKEKEHENAVRRVGDVIETAVKAWVKGEDS